MSISFATKNLLIGSALALSSLAGCAHEGAYLPENTGGHAVSGAPLVLLDGRVQTSVTSTGIQRGMTSDGRLMVAANLQNREERRIQVQVSCLFKDAQGFTIDETPYENLFLDPNAQETVKFTAMNNRAQNFTIRVREAQ